MSLENSALNARQSVLDKWQATLDKREALLDQWQAELYKRQAVLDTREMTLGVQHLGIWK